MPTTPDTHPLLRPVDVADLLSVSRKRVYRLIERGELDPLHVGTSVRIRPESLDAAAFEVALPKGLAYAPSPTASRASCGVLNQRNRVAFPS